jgi:hypothetical protein
LSTDFGAKSSANFGQIRARSQHLAALLANVVAPDAYDEGLDW